MVWLVLAACLLYSSSATPYILYAVETVAVLGPFFTCDFYRFSSSCDYFTISFTIWSNTHFITKQSQEAKKIAIVNGALHCKADIS